MQAVSGHIMARQRSDVPLKEVLADLQGRDRIVGKAHGGRGHEPVREIPVNRVDAD